MEVTRVLDAPRSLVWTVWTEPAHAKQWWGPHGFTVPVYVMDLRPGGAFRYVMQAPDGSLFPGSGTFEEVVAYERIVSAGAANIDGAVAFEARTVVTFADHESKTIVSVEQAFSKTTPAAAEALAGAPIGWSQQFERLGAYLATVVT